MITLTFNGLVKLLRFCKNNKRRLDQYTQAKLSLFICALDNNSQFTCIVSRDMIGLDNGNEYGGDKVNI